MPQRYKEFLIYANKRRFFYEKYRIVSDDNGQSPPPSGHCGKRTKTTDARTKTTDARAKGPHAEGGQARTNEKIPLLYGREGDRDVQIVLGRNGR